MFCPKCGKEIDDKYTSIQDTRLRVANIKKCLPIKERRVSN